jgi:CBS domain-containing protein
MYRVKDVMTEEVAARGFDDSLESAVLIMRDRGCGCVPVIDEKGRVVGLVTDRDAVMCALRAGKGLAELLVREACSRNVICCEAEDTLERAEVLMRVNHVRRLPVVGRDRALVGLISLTDLARHVEFSAVASCNGLSPRHIAVVLAETSGVRRPRPSEAHRLDHETRPHPIVETIFHG